MPVPRLKFYTDVYRPDAKIWRFLSVLVLSGVAFGLYRGIQDNYLADMVNITPFERGIVEFFRETPGLLLVFILALMYRFSESKIFKIGVAIMAGGVAGLLLTSSSQFFMTKFFVVVFMVIFSTGEHLVMPVRTTISMDLAKREKAGASLGITSSITQLGHIIGFFLVTIIFFFLARMGFERTDIFGYRIVFGASVSLMIVSVMVALALKETSLKTQRRRFYFTPGGYGPKPLCGRLRGRYF